MLPAGFTRMPIWRRWFGRRAERFAAKYLRRQGCRILGRNVDDRLGEIDLLALDGQTIVVVEQNFAAATALASRAYILNNGHIVYDGTVPDLRAAPDVMTRYLGI